MTPLPNELGSPVTGGTPNSVLLRVYRSAVAGASHPLAVTVSTEVEYKISEVVRRCLSIINLDAKGV